MFTRVFEHLKNQEAKAACMLPNQARYQLRYIPMLNLPKYYTKKKPFCQ
jgi:hypothetical protein